MKSDEELLEAIAEKNENAFDLLYQRHKTAVYRAIIRIIRNPDTARELCTEAFVKVWNRCDQWERRGPGGAWIRRIAVNTALDWFRSREGKIEAASVRRRVEEFSGLPEGKDAEPDYLLIRRELRRTVQETVQQLPESKKEIISLFLEEDLTTQEMAERLGIPEGTVKSRFYYARLDLKNRLADEI